MASDAMEHEGHEGHEGHDAREEREAPVAAEYGDRYRALPRVRYDLVIVGGGSAGIVAAELAAALGVSVALLDRVRLGGECLYTGCVASKALLHVAREAARIRAAAALGLDARLAPVDLAAVSEYVQRAIGTIQHRSDDPEHFQRLGVDVGFGAIRFVSPNSIALNGQPVRAKRFLIATGSHPSVPPIPGLAEAGYVTNETIFALRTPPHRLAVIGGGPIGCELGQAFARLGSQVTILQRPERLLPRDEPEAAAVLRARLEAEGVRVVTRADVQGVALREEGKVLRFAPSDARSHVGELVVDEILMATGRMPNVEGLDLEAAGVAHTVQGITVNDHLRTSNPRIYAAGDVIGGYRFTHAAALQARTAVRNALFPFGKALDERMMPWATFTEPEVAHVGLTEAQARQRYHHGDDVRVVAITLPMRDVDRAVTDGATDGFFKLVVAPNGRLLGAQIVGAQAGEVINELALAIEQELGLSDLAATTHVYPTIALGIQQAAGQYVADALRGRRVVRLLRKLLR